MKQNCTKIASEKLKVIVFHWNALLLQCVLKLLYPTIPMSFYCNFTADNTYKLECSNFSLGGHWRCYGSMTPRYPIPLHVSAHGIGVTVWDKLGKGGVVAPSAPPSYATETDLIVHAK